MSGTHAERTHIGADVFEAAKERAARLSKTSSELGIRAAELCERGAIRLEAGLTTLFTTRRTRDDLVQRTLESRNGVDPRIADSLVRHGHANKPSYRL